jgi:broad specificity phosphatase PhoE
VTGPGPRVYLVRHGETDWNRHGLVQGTMDIPLNASGRLQARSLADTLSAVRFDAAYTSPLHRARETAAEILADRPDVPLIAVPELREMCYGLWQGRGAAPRRRTNPGLDRRWRDDPWSVRFPGGDSLADVSARTRDLWARLVREHSGQTVLVAGHGHVNRLLLIQALDLPPASFWEIRQPNGCCYLLEPGASSVPRPILEGTQ